MGPSTIIDIALTIAFTATILLVIVGIVLKNKWRKTLFYLASTTSLLLLLKTIFIVLERIGLT